MWDIFHLLQVQLLQQHWVFSIFWKLTVISTDDIVAVGCDGTDVNTGRKGGVIHMVEMILQRPIQWIITLLPSHGLSLRHLIEDLDGKTTGPKGFTAPLGRQLNYCEKLPVADSMPLYLPTLK